MTNISGDGVPYVLRLDHLDGCLPGWMGETMDDIEDLPSKSGGYPGSGGTGADVTQDGRTVWKVYALQDDR